MCKDTKIPRILQINLPFTLLFGVNKRYKNALPPVFSAISPACAAFGMVSGCVRDLFRTHPKELVRRAFFAFYDRRQRRHFVHVSGASKGSGRA